MMDWIKNFSIYENYVKHITVSKQFIIKTCNKYIAGTNIFLQNLCYDKNLVAPDEKLLDMK